MALTPKQLRFVEEYPVDLNATAAYRRAGYKARGHAAEVNASRLLSNAEVAAAIAAAAAERSERVGVTAGQVLRELAKVAFSDMRDYTTWGPDGVVLKASDELAEGAATCVAEVSQTTSEGGGSLKFKLYDKVQALQLLGRHLKLFTDRLELTGGVRMLITEEIVDSGDADR